MDSDEVSPENTQNVDESLDEKYLSTLNKSIGY